VVVIGVGESLNNIGLALTLLVIARVITTLGVARARGMDVELADPHAR
jgi:hypothetical protein